MLKKIAIAVLVLVVLFIGFVATRPSTYTVKRSATIAAGPDKIFPMVTDFHQWSTWSPWEALDPQMTRTFDGATSGVGAIYSWKGNDQVGEGRMTIEESRPNEYVKIKLEFIKPWAATNRTELSLRPAGNSTEVEWTMSGTHDFMGKAFTLFMNMDTMIGKDFEKGLQSIKTGAEKAATMDTSGTLTTH